MNGWRKINPGDKVKASDMQLAIDQGVSFFPDWATRDNALGTDHFDGMLSHLANMSHLQVYQSNVALGSTAWVPLGLLNMTHATGNSYGIAPNSPHVMSYTADVFINIGDSTNNIKIFSGGTDTSGNINLPWRGIYLVATNGDWKASNTTGDTSADRFTELYKVTGTNANIYGYNTKVKAHSIQNNATTANSIGLIVNGDSGAQTWRWRVYHNATLPSGTTSLTFENASIALYMLSSVWGNKGW